MAEKKRNISAALKQLELDRKAKQAIIKRGSQYPPLSIEPMPNERQRLSKPMTPEERAARRQWILDQKLAPNEPRNFKTLEAYTTVPHDVKPLNPIRRFYRKPFDILFKALEPLVGAKPAYYGRALVPKLLLGYVIAGYMYYYSKYRRNTWENTVGINAYGGASHIGEVRPFPTSDDFVDRGFKKRTCLLDLKTSTDSPLSPLAGQPYE